MWRTWSNDGLLARLSTWSRYELSLRLSWHHTRLLLLLLSLLLIQKILNQQRLFLGNKIIFQYVKLL